MLFFIFLSQDVTTTWCTQQVAVCRNACGGTTQQNTCNTLDLAWSCICKNGSTPIDSQVDMTIPYFQCQQSLQQCKDKCSVGQNDCYTNCDMVNKCGKVKGTTTQAQQVTEIPMENSARKSFF